MSFVHVIVPTLGLVLMLADKARMVNESYLTSVPTSTPMPPKPTPTQSGADKHGSRPRWINISPWLEVVEAA